MPSPQQSTPAASARWGVVPFITAWSSEEAPPATIISGERGIAYADETVLDRDRHGVLWARNTSSPGVGRPLFKNVHHLRQRRAMRRLLCQVCGTPCGTDARWLLSAAEYREDPWPSPVLTSHPPVCPDCVDRSVRLCPHLRDGHVALTADRPRPAAVSGILYHPTILGPAPMRRATLTFDDPLLPWLRAAQLHMRLDDYRVLAP
ncbi:hypothetical protein [Actinomadura atramentaria]|uniref:hypothetical protein n=1 Tax=Actinomadura atramentaria TaxID=1990 RepID=UPI000373E9A9|nr:hypothetical protein [Actinomadura atramentaria]